MGDTLEQAVRTALRAVRDPVSGRDVVEAGMVEGLTVKGGMVQFAIQVPRERARDSEPLRAASVFVNRATRALFGVAAAPLLAAARAGAPMAPRGRQLNVERTAAAQLRRACTSGGANTGPSPPPAGGASTSLVGSVALAPARSSTATPAGLHASIAKPSGVV
jgi:ATP-binding protein involved in chromosome partitioning